MLQLLILLLHAMSWISTSWINDQTNAFENSTVDVLAEPLQSDMVSVTVRTVTDSNKHLIPEFAHVQFEFFSLSQSKITSAFSTKEYQQMLGRLVTEPNDEFGFSTRNNNEPILNAVIEEFGDRHSMNLKIVSTRFATPEIGGSHIHFDETQEMRLWIPITDTFIDNFSLCVEDTTRIPQCMRNRQFRDLNQNFVVVPGGYHVPMKSRKWTFLIEHGNVSRS